MKLGSSSCHEEELFFWNKFPLGTEINSTKSEDLYIGTKTSDEPKVIGDIVFVDGSAIPYSEDIDLSDLQKSLAEAVIYYTDGRTDLGERTLGVNIHNSNGTKLEGIYIASSFAGSNLQYVHYANLSKRTCWRNR